jgi:hypothetical protein
MIKRLELFIERRDRISRTGVPRQVENEICAIYSSKFKNMHTQLPPNGQGISGCWFLDA